MDKEFILAEIRRTAELNGGEPLGARRLATEAGIHQKDWDKYWLRLSDAVREAGFAPNKLNKRLDRGILLEAYVRYAIELGQLPFYSHLKKRRREDRSFPRPEAFIPKREFIAQLVEFCQKNSAFAGALPWCEEYLLTTKISTKSIGITASNYSDAYVYLAKTRRGYKIGRTEDWEQRLRQIQLHNADDVELVHLIKTDDSSGVEAYWHRRFKTKRVVAKSKTGKRRNWYDLTADDVRAFKRWRQI